MAREEVVADEKRPILAGSVAVDQRDTTWLSPDRCPECGEESAGDGRFDPLCPRCLIWIALDGDVTDKAADNDGGASNETYPYRIVRVLGEGGMGIVYLAEQVAPVRRQVAVKVLKPGLDSKTVLARFEAERQALAMMNHPNIARVLEAGQTRTGRPYFVMELVEGESITRYCDRRRLSLRERLELFAVVCRAVQHAHHKGIIHRDLKSSNILVTTTDDRPVPKVIDFGLAKATRGSLTDETLVTRQGEFMGTPAYMSPEQAALDGVRLDTRTDVYSLGVVLYELLAGAPPFESDTLRRASHAEILRILREEEPPRPSLRMSDPGIDPSVAAARRQVDAAGLGRRLRGDLDWIVLKALAKDRARRYPTPHALATDVIRHLNHELVEAGPPSALYRFRKFARRNRVALGVSAAVAFGVLAAAAGLSVALVESNRQRAGVESALGEVERARSEAEAVVGFLEETLAAADPGEQGRDVTVREALDEAASTIDTRFAGQPLVEARLRATIGSSYEALGHWDVAGPHLERALEIRRNLLGEDAEETLMSLSALGILSWRKGNYEEAAALQEESLRIRTRVLGEEHPDTLWSMNNLALVYDARGEHQEAARLHERIVEVRTRVLGAEHSDTVSSMNNLANAYYRQGRLEEAGSLFERVLEIWTRERGEDDPHTLSATNNLANTYSRLGRDEEAARLHEICLEARVRILGEEHPQTLGSMVSLGSSYARHGRYDEAARLFEDSLKLVTQVFGENHPTTIILMGNLAGAYSRQGRYEEAIPVYHRAVEAQRKTVGEGHPRTLGLVADLGAAYVKLGEPENGEPILVEAMEIGDRTLPTDDSLRGRLRHKLGVCMAHLGRYPEAERYLLEAHDILGDGAGARHAYRAEVASALVILYEWWERPEDAARWRQPS